MFFAKKGAIFVKFRFDFSCHNRKDMLTLLLIISFGFLFQLDDNKKYLKINIDDIESIAVFSKKEVIDINKYLEQLNTYKHVFKIEKNRYIWSYSEKQS